MDWAIFARVALAGLSAAGIWAFWARARARRRERSWAAPRRNVGLAEHDADTLRMLRADLLADLSQDPEQDTVVCDASELMARLREQSPS